MVRALQQKFDVRLDGEVAQPADRLVRVACPAGVLLHGHLLGPAHLLRLETLWRFLHHPPHAGTLPTIRQNSHQDAIKQSCQISLVLPVLFGTFVRFALGIAYHIQQHP